MSSSQPPPFPVITRGTKRSHAKRCCLACRRQKTRCELPEIAIDFPSSRDQVPMEYSCHRCRKLGIPCIIFDEQLKGNRKNRTKLPKGTNPTVFPSQDLPFPTEASPLLHGHSSDASQAQAAAAGHGSYREVSHSSSSPPTQTSMDVGGTDGFGKGHSTSSETADISVVWRPISLLTKLLMIQPEFGSISRTQLDINFLPSSPTDIVESGLSDRIDTCFRSYYTWMPHLPSLNCLRQKHLESPTISTSLLLSSMYLLALRNLSGDARIKGVRTQLNSLAQRDLARVLLIAPADIHAVQALELVAVFTPLDFGGRDITTGFALIAVASRIAATLRLVQAPAHVMRLRAASNRDQFALDEALRRATTYYSLRLWELSFAFNDPQLIQIPLASEELNAVDVLSPESSSYQDLLLRVVGRIGIAHRLRSLRKFHDWCHKFLMTNRKEPLPDRVNRVSKLLAIMLSEMDVLQRERSSAFGPYMEDPSAALISKWIEMETRSGHLNILGRGLSWGFRPRHLISTEKRVSILDQDSDGPSATPMLPVIIEWGRRLLDIAETVLVGFISMEQYYHSTNDDAHPISPNEPTWHALGSPPMTTCAIVVSATASITEAHAALYTRWFQASEQAESYLVIMRQAAKCLAAMDPAGAMVVGSIPGASAQVVIVMASAMSKWLEDIRIAKSNPSMRSGTVEEFTEEPPALPKTAGPSLTTANVFAASAPEVLWQRQQPWPVHSSNISALGNAYALDVGNHAMPAGAVLNPDTSLDRLFDVNTGAFDWTMFNILSSGAQFE